MRRISYGELLRIIVQNLENHYFQFDKFTIEYEQYKISYDLRDSVLYYRSLDSNLVVDSYCYFFEYAEGEFYYIRDNCETIPVPQTKEDWFMFAIENEQTKEDFDNLMKIHDYVKNIR